MTPEEKKSLEYIVERVAELEAQKKDIAEEVKELLDSAWEKTGIQKKAVKQLAKEKGWNEVERIAQRQLEEELDNGRAALGMLADTPLGEHAQARAQKKVAKPASKRSKVGDMEVAGSA